MDEIVKHLMDTAGSAAVKAAIDGMLKAIAAGCKKVLSRKDKKDIGRAAEKMIQAVTMDDVHRYDPKVSALTTKLSGKFVETGRRAGPAKKGAPKRRPVTKKATVNRSAVKKSATKKR
jgi:hypothetical protein